MIFGPESTVIESDPGGAIPNQYTCSLCRPKSKRHCHYPILKLKPHRAPTIFGFVSWVTLVGIGSSHLYTRYRLP